MGLRVTPEMCRACFDVVLSELRKTPYSLPDGIFVTWKLRRGSEYGLRGCIGSLREVSLSELAYYARVGVSLLYEFEDALGGAYDWEPGTHGIILSLENGGREYSATYLPEVASEQGWDRKETLNSLLEKAGFHGDLTSVVDKIHLRRYKSAKGHLSYDDYVKMSSP